MTVEIRFDTVHIDGDTPTTRHEALLRTVAGLTIEQDGVAVWSEIDVPILELAYHLHRWLSLAAPRHAPFAYESMESDEKEWLWFKPSRDQWAMGAGPTLLLDGVSFDELTAAAKRFVDDVIRDVPPAVDVDAQGLISDPS
ncbi:MAG TPA: hypothetical protein VGQ42_17000 [Candidatus Dormibacteraeota bacterium]|jgi:hypothetical protein|nr:hypothetical protein [Candidatus Dormibacteraeota bacterium]